MEVVCVCWMSLRSVLNVMVLCVSVTPMWIKEFPPYILFVYVRCHFSASDKSVCFPNVVFLLWYVQVEDCMRFPFGMNVDFLLGALCLWTSVYCMNVCRELCAIFFLMCECSPALLKFIFVFIVVIIGR